MASENSESAHDTSHKSVRTAADEYELFRQRRNEMAVLPQGNLALFNTAWMLDPVGQWGDVWGAEGSWAAREPSVGGVALRADLSDGVTVNGEPVDGEITVFPRGSVHPSEISFASGRTATIIVNDDGQCGVRIWDAESDDIRNFGRIDAFDYSPDWVITGRFTPVEGGIHVQVEHLKDGGGTRDKVVPGEITFSIAGVDYQPMAFVEGRALMIVFSDATNGESTYSVGRFLLCAPNPDGTITLDFNRAYLPPCAFNYNFNCPIPPLQNRFPFAVTAGEKNVLNESGELLHG